MISIDTERKVIELLLAIAECERSVEIGRQMLNDAIQDNSNDLFKILDMDNRNSIDSFNIKYFMERNNTFISLTEAQMIILFYDANGDGVLSYYEFLNLIQSSTALYPKCTQVSLCHCDSKYSLNDIEDLLSNILDIELVNVRTLMEYLKLLQSLPDFNIDSLFNEIKKYNSITSESLILYFEKNKITVSYQDISHIIHRLDLNRDGKVDQAEFFAFFEYQVNNKCPYYDHYPKQNFINHNDLDVIRNVSAEDRTYILSPKSEGGINSYNEPNLQLRLSPKRHFSPTLKNSNYTNDDPLKSSSSTTIKVIEGKGKSIEENKFLDYVKFLMQIESKIEKDKIDLALRPDFNVINAFHLFLKSPTMTFISEEDLKSGLSILDIVASSSEIEVMMQRWDLNKEGVIDYYTFFDIVTPFETNYRNMVQLRRESTEPFQLSTKIYLQGVMKIILSSEMKINMMKNDFSSIRSQLKKIYGAIDKKNKGFFTSEEWENYLQEKNIIENKKSAALVFIRLDRKRSGKVTYSDLKAELTPYRMNE